MLISLLLWPPRRRPNKTGSRSVPPPFLNDSQWGLIKDLFPHPSISSAGGRPRKVNMREVLNAMLYLTRTGCQYDMLPHDLLPKSTVYQYFAQWRDSGVWQDILDVLREAVRSIEAPSQ